MILDVDIGNTRLKWRVTEASGNNAQRIAEGATDTVPELAAEVLRYPIERARASCVAGPRAEADFGNWSQSEFGVKPLFARVQDSVGGVRLAYAEPASFGVDRWLAILAGFRSAGGACVVLDAGSALTADFVDARGFHRGGLIAPGIHLMQDALSRRTSAVQTSALTLPQKWRPGSDTLGCVENGLAAMLTGFAAEVAIHGRDQLGQEVHLLACGGDAEKVIHYCPEFTLAPNLVLDGLAMAFDA